MKNLNIAVANKVASYCQRDGFIVCGNSDYQITFTFDSDWNGYTKKTARFKWNGGHRDVEIKDDNTVKVPIIENVTQVEIGVYVKNLSTTTPAVIPCTRSILCDSTSEYITPAEVKSLREEIESLKQSVLTAAEMTTRVTNLENDKLDANGWETMLSGSIKWTHPDNHYVYTTYGAQSIVYDQDQSDGSGKGKLYFPKGGGTIAVIKDLEGILARLTALENK